MNRLFGGEDIIEIIFDKHARFYRQQVVHFFVTENVPLTPQSIKKY